MSAFLIKPACFDDLETLNDLMFDLHDEHHVQSPELFKTAEEIEQEKSIARYLDDPECLVYVAKLEEEIVGFVSGHFCELTSTVSQPVMMGSVDELYVLPEFRKQGVAKKLLDKIESVFVQYGVKQMFVEVWDFNQQALSLYGKQGFGHHIHCLRKPLTSKPDEVAE
ncbi:GNAT family N-acetyltransferase [Vibrio sp. B1FLJ16]|uniref:GNAT family N-acetyltransferase n=1 Tax=Vibrio sp. B1FLJ16 TaxID=2751178 RepID=UPI0015F5D587|nr:GNAT family N-acetyltransferase [Vibrio sp. B1FLJ16]CAD7805526.1 COG0454 Histone acetyltransferase HPA2 and related acetyltransferases [Vibrio sp. B1FLJ16]CAE6901019.1 COG0454 Histone acetyltransferase HPA2 and related acetyltransferases [Vibrio sp. B1FLJ16]